MLCQVAAKKYKKQTISKKMEKKKLKQSNFCLVKMNLHFFILVISHIG